ncbi:MAG: glutamate--cysteine ligase [Alphaproteobacteria bacterium]|nr:glutamate--cysteine ligase [Alphaproteobacteria bacterium]MBE8220194.1 glutamate--cysteine ligase [Alphaproteobacteria bacterium]
MPDILENTNILESTDALKAWMEAGSTPRDAWRIGTEHEKLGFHRDKFTPLPYGGTQGIRAMLEGLMAYGWRGKYEEGEILVGLVRDDGASVTLEPGGQLELSGAPLATIHQTCEEIDAHLKEVHEVATPLEQAYLGVGYSPLWTLPAAAQMPKGRYKLMRDYMPRCGTRGLEMMHLSCTVQVNLDFADEADMVEKLRIGLALQPVITALFANSPFVGAVPSGNISERGCVWQQTDNVRTGMLPLAFAQGFGFEHYVDYALDVPMYFVIRDGVFINCLGASFRDFLDGKLEALPNEKPTAEDWESHLTTLFPEARVKRYIEMRGADSGVRGALCALPALWVGLLYDSTSQSQIAAMIADWTQSERETLYRQAPVHGFATPFRDTTLLALARQILDIAEAGLARRACGNGAGLADETMYLSYLREMTDSGQNLSDKLLHAFHNEWQGDIHPIFKELCL